MRADKHPREHAAAVLTQVLSGKVTLDQALETTKSDERAWLQDICAGTLRWKGRLGWIIDSTALKKKPSGQLRKLLLIGAYQLIAQDRVVPAKIVSETVNEIKRLHGAATARFANASLRKIADHAPEWKNWKLDPDAKNGEAAAWASLPEWIWKKLRDQHGKTWASEYAARSLERPTLWLRAKDEGFKPSWAEPGPVPLSWRVTESGAITEKPGFKEGRFIVQDISSQLLVSEIIDIVRENSHKQNIVALDLCAAPGGKTVGLAWNGFAVWAADKDQKKLSLLEQTLTRTRLSKSAGVEIISREKVSHAPAFDLVWVDAPCSGSGIIRRHPDVRWRKKESDLPSLLSLQKTLINEGYSKVKPGGFLAYSVCSVFKEEGPGILEALPETAKTVRQWLLATHEPPHGDGFWATVVRKT